MALSSVEIMVSWEEVPRIHQNGIIKTYEVLYEPQETFGGTITSVMLNSTNRSIVLSGLQEFVTYNISISAYTSVGSGPYSDVMPVRTFENGKEKE